MTLWLVRAGSRGEMEDLALDKGMAVIGWGELGDLTRLNSRDEIMALLQRTFPDTKPASIYTYARELWYFSHVISAGDIVVLPLKKRSAIVIGRVTGPYAYRPDLPADARHTVPVDWIKELPRNSFDQDLLRSFGTPTRVCEIYRNNSEERIRAILEAGSDLTPPPQEIPQEMMEEEAIGDLEQQAMDQIVQYIGRNFTGHRLARLAAALLEAQGYRVEVSSEGPDGGVDIIAGMGPMGFDPPRLCVQVKSGSQIVDVKVLRELHGVISRFGADRGLLISWGGFRRSVYTEARQMFFQIRLWDSGQFVDNLLAYYDRLPDEIKAELPLKRIWALVMEE